MPKTKIVFFPCTSLFVSKSCNAGGSGTLPSAPILSYPGHHPNPKGNPLRAGLEELRASSEKMGNTPAEHSFPATESRGLRAKRQPSPGPGLPVLPVEVLPGSGLLWQF